MVESSIDVELRDDEAARCPQLLQGHILTRARASACTATPQHVRLARRLTCHVAGLTATSCAGSGIGLAKAWRDPHFKVPKLGRSGEASVEHSHVAKAHAHRDADREPSALLYATPAVRVEVSIDGTAGSKVCRDAKELDRAQLGREPCSFRQLAQPWDGRGGRWRGSWKGWRWV